MKALSTFSIIITDIALVLWIIKASCIYQDNNNLQKQLQIEKLRSEKYFLMYKLHHQIEAMPFNEWNKKKQSLKNVTIK